MYSLHSGLYDLLVAFFFLVHMNNIRILVISLICPASLCDRNFNVGYDAQGQQRAKPIRFIYLPTSQLSS